MKKQITVLLILVIGLSSGAGAAFPKPAVVQKVSQWTLTVKYETPEQITLRLPGKAAPERFWYIILTLTNESSQQEVPFFPACEMVTDNFEIIPAGMGVPKGVFDAIKLKHQGRYPFLESLDFEDNRVHFGPDNTRDVVIIWKDFNLKAKEVSLFIGGLCKENAGIAPPSQADDKRNPEQGFLQKKLQLRYKVGAGANLFPMGALEV